MKTDRFVLDLFLGELRSNSAIIKDALGKDVDCSILENVVRSLRSSAKLVGFVELAALFGALENFFSSKNLFSDEDKNARECVGILDELSSCSPENIEEKVEALRAKINACASSGFTGRTVQDNIRAVELDDAQFERPEIDASMKELFILEAKTQVELISNTLVELEGDFSSKSKLEALMRASHSIKGASRAVGLDSIVELTHQMENCFSAALSGKISIREKSLDVFFQCADFILDLCKNGFSRIEKSIKNSLLEELKAVEQAKVSVVSNPVEPSPTVRENIPSKPQISETSYVRISIDNINSIMALAAESLIENRKFDVFKDELSSIKSEFAHISNGLERLINILNSSCTDKSILTRLELASASLREQNAQVRKTLEVFSDYTRKNTLLASRLYKEVLESRMRPFSDLAQRFPKMVRSYSKSLSKKISFEIFGASTLIDRDLLERLDAPISHILRNCCDHGIESEQQRKSCGKKLSGKISMRASHSSGMFLLTISDDGRGIDVAKVKSKILERKLVPAEILAQMHEDEIFEFLFLPAFTTKDEVTEISGRGVGLDVVQTMLREVGGSVSVSSKIGKGCSFTLKLPITRSVLKSLLVNIDAQPYAFALSSVYRTVMLKRSSLQSDARGQFFLHDNKRVNFVDASRVLGFGQSRIDDENLYVVIIAGRGKFWGFGVDTIPSEAELVVRSLNTSLGKIACVSAAALSAEGMPILILDIDDILIHAGRLSVDTNHNNEAFPKNFVLDAKKVLVVDDSPTVREVERKILENAGFKVDVAVDGVDGWNLVRLVDYDLVVSDIDMPRMTGFELTSKIRKRFPKLPIVIVSYKDRAEEKERALLAGANVYLTKSSFQDDSFIKTALNYT